MQESAGACLGLLDSWLADAHEAGGSSGADASWQELFFCKCCYGSFDALHAVLVAAATAASTTCGR
jgi:hypothetical protein